MLPPTADAAQDQPAADDSPSAEPTGPVADPPGHEGVVSFRSPTLEDGREMWRMARDSKVLDLNSSYSYLLWCRDFAATSVVATVDGVPAGYVTGYLRPERPDTLMVWQVAVDEAHRGRGLAGRMLSWLVDEARTGDPAGNAPTGDAPAGDAPTDNAPAVGAAAGVARMETTITPDNEASIALFSSFAARRGAEITREPVFDGSLFPDGHESELLFSIAPLS